MKADSKSVQAKLCLLEDDVIVCPWCMAMSIFNFDNQICCEVCGREITEEDLNNQSINQEGE